MRAYTSIPAAEHAANGPGIPWLQQTPEPRTLDRREELMLVRQARAGDRWALERLVQANLRLILREARRYPARTQSFEDLVQEGLLAFVEALAGYDESRGFRLMTYALHRVRRALARGAARDGMLLSPSHPEMVSLEAPVGPDNDSLLLELVEDPDAADPERDTLHRMDGVLLRRLLGQLPDRERRVVEERFGFSDGNPHTVEELSRRLRLPRERIRQIEAAAMRRLRGLLVASQGD